MRKSRRERQELIATVNDVFRRRGVSSGMRLMVMPGVQELDDVSGLIEAVQSFDEGNDPYGEHDFGSLEWYGSMVFWKIDYYDWALKYGEDPLSPKCKRVLTVMLASEY